MPREGLRQQRLVRSRRTDQAGCSTSASSTSAGLVVVDKLVVIYGRDPRHLSWRDPLTDSRSPSKPLLSPWESECPRVTFTQTRIYSPRG